MRVVSASVEIAANPMQVWHVLADLDRYQEWNPFIQSASGDLRVGATLTLRMVPAAGRAITFRPTVLEVQQGVRIRWIGHFIVPGVFDGAHQFALEDLGEGKGTRLVQSEEFTGVLVPFARKTLDSAQNSDFLRLNQALKERAER